MQGGWGWGRIGGKDSLEVLDGLAHTALFKMDNQQGPTYCIAQGTLLNVMRQPGWEGSLGRMDTCVCMAEGLCCPPESIMTLLIH